MHGDHGTQFAPRAFTSKVEKYGLGLGLGLGTIGDCHENAVIFWFRRRLQAELLDRKKWTTILELSTKITDNIDTLQKWCPSSLDMLTPTEYENPYAPML